MARADQRPSSSNAAIAIPRAATGQIDIRRPAARIPNVVRVSMILGREDSYRVGGVLACYARIDRAHRVGESVAVRVGRVWIEVEVVLPLVVDPVAVEIGVAVCTVGEGKAVFRFPPRCLS